MQQPELENAGKCGKNGSLCQARENMQSVRSAGERWLKKTQKRVLALYGHSALCYFCGSVPFKPPCCLHVYVRFDGFYIVCPSEVFILVV